MDGIQFASQLAAGCMSENSILLNCRFVSTMLLTVSSDSMVWHFDKIMFLLCFKAAKNTRNAKPFNMVVEFRLDLICDKNDATHRLSLRAHCHWVPGASRGVVFIDFHWFS